jgi:signal transduction histidine kinase
VTEKSKEPSAAQDDLAQGADAQQQAETTPPATTSDETTRRLAERTRALEEALGRLEAILSSIGDGVLLENLQHNFIPLNDAARNMLQDMADHFLVGDLEELATENLEEGTSPANPWLIERRRFEMGGKVIGAHSAAVRSKDGERLGTVIVLRDVTAEAETDRLKDAFVAHVSHELRTPLTAIKGYTELMLIGAIGPMEDEQRHFVKTIHHHTQSLVNMINTLLDFSEMEARGELALNRHPVQLATLVEKITEPWYLQMDDKRLAFNVEIADDLPQTSVDEKRLQWVIENLVRNAWQYTSEGGSVTVRLYEQDGNVILDVTDTGIGISARDQQQLFTRFYRVETAANIRGIGLGLYVSKAVLDAHGGKIRVSSKQGVGSTFSLILPVLQDEGPLDPISRS